MTDQYDPTTDPRFTREQQDLLKTVDFSNEVRAFLGSPIGQYLTQRIEDERAAALEELATIDAEDAKAIRRHQNQIAMVDAIGRWLAQAVDNGVAAKMVLINGE